MRPGSVSLFVWSITVVFSSIPLCWGQPPAAPAPVPSQIINAHKIFISNAGGEEGDPRIFLRSMTPDRPYDEFYGTLKNGGRFEPVPSPAEADLVLDFRFRTFNLGAAELRLVIIDPKTHALLWAFTETVKNANGPHRDEKVEKNFSAAISALVNDLTALATPVAPAAVQK